MGIDESGQFLRSGRPAAAADQPSVTPDVEQRRGPADVERAHLVEVALGVHVHVRRGRGGWSAGAPAAPSSSGTDRRTPSRTGRRSGRPPAAGRRGARRPARPPGPVRSPRPPAVRTAPLRVRSHQATPAVTTSAHASATIPIGLTPAPTRSIRCGYSRDCRVSREHRVGRPRPRTSTPSSAGYDVRQLQAERQRRHGVPQVEQVAGPLDEEVRQLDAGPRRPLDVDDQLVAVEGDRAGGGQRAASAPAARPSW